MQKTYEDLINRAYTAFNSRDIDRVFLTLDPNVQWANGWEGGYVKGHNELRNYWIRQWNEINPNVRPVGFKERENHQIEVDVHQIAKDLQGNVLFDGMIKHIYTIENGLIKNMDIEKP